MYILGTRNGETAEKLSVHLKNCVTVNRLGELPEDVNFSVNYGRKGVSDIADVNANLISNKLEQLRLFQLAGLNIPIVYPIPENIFQIDRTLFPLLARKTHHSKGWDAIFLKTRKSLGKRLNRIKAKRDYLIQYIYKDSEYRVHVLGDECAGISKKVKHEEADRHHRHVWSRPRGWIQVDYEGACADELFDVGKKAIKALGYDFGAVDIIKGVDGKYYVLEVNSAPRLNRRRRKLYAQFFRKKYKEKRANRRREIND